MEEPEGETFRELARRRSNADRVQAKLGGYGLSLMIAASMAVLVTFIIEAAEKLGEWRLHTIKHHMEKNIVYAWGFATGTSLGFALLGAFFVFLEPSAGGSGMPEVISYLNGVKFRKYISWRTLVFKAVGVIAILSAGLFSGSDGPIAHIGMIVAILYLRGISKASKQKALKSAAGDKMATELALVNAERLKKSQLTMTATGAAAGITSVFRSPLGGVMFSIEEASSFHEPSLIIRTLFTTLTVNLLAGLLRWALHPKGALTMSSFAPFKTDTSCFANVSGANILSYLIFGVLGGLLGWIHNFFVIMVTRFRRKFLFPRPWLRFIEIILLCFITAAVVVMIPNAVDTCTPKTRAISHVEAIEKSCILRCDVGRKELLKRPECSRNICVPTSLSVGFDDLAAESYTKLYEQCASGNATFQTPLVRLDDLSDFFEMGEDLDGNEEEECYFELRSLLLTMPEHALKVLFKRGVFNLFSPMTLIIFASVYFVFSILTYHVMLPTDLVLPNLLVGASLGRLYGIGVGVVFQKLGVAIPDPGHFAVLGASTFWSGTSRLIMTIALIAVETTMKLDDLPGIVTCVLLATIVGNLLGEGQFHAEMHEMHISYLSFKPPHGMRGVTVEEVMKTQIYSFRVDEAIEKVEAVYNKHAGQWTVPVVEESVKDGKVMKKFIGVVTRGQMKMCINASISGNTINLRNIVVKPALTVNVNMTASKVFNFYRKMGIRCLYVLDDEQNLVGMVTRDELAHFGHHNHHDDHGHGHGHH